MFVFFKRHFEQQMTSGFKNLIAVNVNYLRPVPLSTWQQALPILLWLYNGDYITPVAPSFQSKWL